MRCTYCRAVAASHRSRPKRDRGAVLSWYHHLSCLLVALCLASSVPMTAFYCGMYPRVADICRSSEHTSRSSSYKEILLWHLPQCSQPHATFPLYWLTCEDQPLANAHQARPGSQAPSNCVIPLLEQLPLSPIPRPKHLLHDLRCR
jgi:hypothetical protein